MICRKHQLLLVAALLFTGSSVSVAHAQDGYHIYDPSGDELSFDEVAAKFLGAEVILVGESHDDSIGHLVELEILEHAFAARTTAAYPRVAVSMEMFTRDVQHVVDEYLQDYITESHFLKASRPWARYETDYKPLVEFAKVHRIPVVAANAPRRYVSRITKHGANALDSLAESSKHWIAPLPYAQASAVYETKWMAAMEESMSGMDSTGGMDHSMFAHMLEAQSLWDATMAHSIVQQLIKTPESAVLHFVGSFHVTKNTGIIEHIKRYRPGTQVVTIVIDPSEDPASPSDEQLLLGDVIVLTKEAPDETD